MQNKIENQSYSKSKRINFDEITVIAALRAKQGQGERLVELYRKLLHKVKEESGTIAYILYRQENDADYFILLERYENKKASEYHCSTTYLKKFTAAANEVLVMPIDFDKQRYLYKVV